MTAAMAGDPRATPSITLSLLGGFRVERADVGRFVPDWRRRSGRTLLKLLATCPRHALHKEQIMEILWREAGLGSALNSFGKALHDARHALEPELPRRKSSAYLKLIDGLLVLSTEHVVVDADRFETLAQDALRRRDISGYESALEVYSGDLLPEDRYEEWCADRRNSISELHIRLLLGLAETLELSGSYHESADRLREVLRHEPTREEAHFRLMRVYAHMGTPDRAVRQFHHCKEILRSELEMSPQPHTLSLFRDVVAGRVQREPGLFPEGEHDGVIMLGALAPGPQGKSPWGREREPQPASSAADAVPPAVPPARMSGNDASTRDNTVSLAGHPGQGSDKDLNENQREELARLRQENEELRVEREVLKRSVALWVKEAMGH